MNLHIINLQKKFPVTKKKIEKKIRQILLLQNKPRTVLSIVLVDDKIIKKLNRAFLHKNRPTDVLAFDLKKSSQSKNLLDGEIIVSLETASNNAKIYKTSFEYETLLYLAHGVLHLCGFDDKTKKEKLRIRRREKYILKRIF